MLISSAYEQKRTLGQISQVTADGVIEGYAAVFDVEDMAGDVIVAGAFANSLRNKGPGGIKLLYQHNADEPIGHWLDVYEDKTGLFVRGVLVTAVPRARDTLALVRAGALDGLSIGFHAVKAETHPMTGVRTLYEIDLWEISIVTFPMQPQARLAPAKSALERYPS